MEHPAPDLVEECGLRVVLDEVVSACERREDGGL